MKCVYINIGKRRKNIWFKERFQVFNRGLFYAANAIIYQYKTVFKISHYDSINKVYSVFICFDAPTVEENSITYFHLSKDIKIGYNKYVR